MGGVGRGRGTWTRNEGRGRGTRYEVRGTRDEGRGTRGRGTGGGGRGDEGASKVRIGGERAERVWVRRRRSLWLAGGCSRGAGATPGCDGVGIRCPEGISRWWDIPAGEGVVVARLPGVGGAPRHQPPANHRERLRRTRERAPRVHLGYVGIRNRAAVRGRE